MEYIKEHPSADRLGLVCFSLVLREVVRVLTPPSCAGLLKV